MKFVEILKVFLQKFCGTCDSATVDYVCGNGEALPLPLSAEEEQNSLRLLLHGEEQERGDAKARLIQHNLRLVVYISKKFDNTGVDSDDLISIGTIGLIKAIHSFNPEKNIKLATYASRCIENEILMYLRRTARLKSEVSFDEPLNTDFEGNELLLSDVLGTSADTDEVFAFGIGEQLKQFSNRDGHTIIARTSMWVFRLVLRVLGSTQFLFVGLLFLSFDGILFVDRCEQEVERFADKRFTRSCWCCDTGEER